MGKRKTHHDDHARVRKRGKKSMFDARECPACCSGGEKVSFIAHYNIECGRCEKFRSCTEVHNRVCDCGMSYCYFCTACHPSNQLFRSRDAYHLEGFFGAGHGSTRYNLYMFADDGEFVFIYKRRWRGTDNCLSEFIGNVRYDGHGVHRLFLRMRINKKIVGNCKVLGRSLIRGSMTLRTKDVSGDPFGRMPIIEEMSIGARCAVWNGKCGAELEIDGGVKLGGLARFCMF